MQWYEPYVSKSGREVVSLPGGMFTTRLQVKPIYRIPIGIQRGTGGGYLLCRGFLQKKGIIKEKRKRSKVKEVGLEDTFRYRR